MALKFKLSIALGNEAMSTAPDVADALRTIAKGIEQAGSRLGIGVVGFVFDVNGNRVGGWKIVPEVD